MAGQVGKGLPVNSIIAILNALNLCHLGNGNLNEMRLLSISIRCVSSMHTARNLRFTAESNA